MYLGYGFSCEWTVELFVVSQGTPLSVVVANRFLISVVGMLVVIEVDQYRIGSLVPIYSRFKALDSSVPWCFTEDFVGLDGYTPRSFGALG